MEAGVFAKGTGTYPELYKDEVKWVATRGGIHDWAVYYHTSDKSDTFVKEQGDKAFTESVIKRLVPCDDEAWKMYRQ